MNPYTYTIVANICSKLTDDELDSLYLCVMSNQNPKDKLFVYEKVELLFTERSGLRVHNDVKEALGEIVLERHNNLSE